jgi:HSP20 family molecular chaperone IbpA
MIYTERLHGEFVRRIPLPAAADPSGMQVNFAQGLLLIRLPKRPAAATSAEVVGTNF